MNSFVVFACLLGVAASGFLGGGNQLGGIQQQYTGQVENLQQGFGGQIGLQQGYAGEIGGYQQGGIGQFSGVEQNFGGQHVQHFVQNGYQGGQQILQGQYAGAGLGNVVQLGGQQIGAGLENQLGGQQIGAGLENQLGGQQAEAHVQFVAHHAGQQYGHGGHHEQYDHHAPAHYAFEYSVHDPHTGDIKAQQETREGDVVKGFYTLKEADGTIREVHYTADGHNGFNAEVKRIGQAHHPVHGIHHH